jgi:glycosyltransferase involved in cell wall biosynthesis
MSTIKHIYAIIKRRPLLFRILRPIIHRIYRVYSVLSALPDILTMRIQTLKARARVWRARIIKSRFPSLHDATSVERGGDRAIGSRAAGCNIIMLVVSDLRVDPRVEREARALASAGYTITVICPELFEGAGAQHNINWGPGVSIKYAAPSGSNFMSEKPGYCADLLYLEAVQMKPFAFHAHDLSTAYAALAAARVRGAHLIVDFHEWFSENVRWDTSRSAWAPYPPDWKRELQKLEARCLSEASATITVCDSIADAMEAKLGGRRPLVIRNIPEMGITPSREYLPLKQQLGLPESTFVLLYQGGTGPTRLIEPIIESLVDAAGCVLVIRGPSLDLFGPDYLALARRIGVEGRVILAPAVPSRDVVAAALGADAGIYTVAALCRNFVYALPNKIFEYLAADLPVLVAHYPEASRLVVENDVGLIFDPYDPRSIADSINNLIRDQSLRERFSANARLALERMEAGREWQKVVSIYDSLPRA